MGNRYTFSHLWKEDYPGSREPLKYDPNFGFEQQRKPKVQELTKEEMDSANIPYEFRDACVYYRIRLDECKTNNWPFTIRCTGFQDEVQNCYERETLDNMKEFERERRLNARERRIAAAAI